MWLCAHRSEKDHPREYGENIPSVEAVGAAYGSSPRIRGESKAIATMENLNGIIPANTGRISWADWCQSDAWDHPREYGENLVRIISQTPQQGSSPRIRGELLLMRLITSPGGIIPANTGRMLEAERKYREVRDHPREYGENRVFEGEPKTEEGSSPRIRGEYFVFLPIRIAVRIIPANTGRINFQ